MLALQNTWNENLTHNYSKESNNILCKLIGVVLLLSGTH